LPSFNTTRHAAAFSVRSLPVPIAPAAEPYLTERILENSYHVATLDHDAPAIFEESTHFARRVTGP
jgi:hypothetical protein